MSLKIYNSLTRAREDFQPLDPPSVGMYVCGPTVYGHSHLGHAKSYVAFDAVVRWLRVSGYDVSYIQNITDVGHLTDDADEGEDKVIRLARERGLHPMAVAETFTASYLQDMDALGNLRPDIMPRATAHIPEQIAAVEKLIATGHAYESNGSVYFDINSFKEYGKLSGRNVAEMEAGARVAVSAEKRNPADFALWKRADANHIMRWPSPWGAGYPGWHLECSVMSQKYLGDTLDIHGGGMENKFPHHDCEIAQSECLTGAPFVRYWMHNNMCTVNGQKMGKSLGNAISLKQVFHAGHPLLETTYDPVIVRHLILTSHYRQPLDFSDAALKAARSGNDKLRDTRHELTRALARAPDQPATDAVRATLANVEARFTEALNEDFNTAAGIAVLFDLAKHVQTWLRDNAGRQDLAAADALFEKLAGEALGLHWPPQLAGDTRQQDDLIQLLVDLRNDARKNKNFELADTIRDRLTALDINLKDSPQGTTW